MFLSSMFLMFMFMLHVLKQYVVLDCIPFLSNKGAVGALEAVNESDTTATHWSEEEPWDALQRWRIWTSMFAKYKCLFWKKFQTKNFRDVIP